MFEYVEKRLKAKDVQYKRNQKLSSLSPIRIGGEAEMVVYPKTKEDLVFTINVLSTVGTSYKVVGRMSNVLPPDEKFCGVIVKTDGLSSYSFDKTCVYAEAGVGLTFLANQASRASLSGLEELSGIPGTLGGAICGNAGAYGREIADIFESADVYSLKDNRVFTLGRDEAGFGYRKSHFGDSEYVILSARLLLCASNCEKIRELMREYKKRRDLAAPHEPSLGSTFKRPPGAYASELIDKCGLKGMRVGGAVISEIHAGYIVNRDSATSEDVKALVSISENAVMEKFGVHLEREIEYL